MLFFQLSSKLFLICCNRYVVNKLREIAAVQDKFGLQYAITEAFACVNAKDSKPHYYSLNTRAAGFGYQSAFTSIEGVTLEMEKIMVVWGKKNINDRECGL